MVSPTKNVHYTVFFEHLVLHKIGIGLKASFHLSLFYAKGGQKTASLFWLNYQDSNLDRQNQNL